MRHPHVSDIINDVSRTKLDSTSAYKIKTDIREIQLLGRHCLYCFAFRVPAFRFRVSTVAV